MGKVVLLVDDDRFFLKLISELLEQHGYSVATANSWMGFTKSYFSMGEAPDLVLLDINLGGVMSGDKILSAVKKEKRFSSSSKRPKLVLISSCSEKEIAETAAKVCADGYILKDSLNLAGGAAFITKIRSLIS
jgi:CheY-like chemotaxis protein